MSCQHRDVTPDGLAPDRDVTPDGLAPDRDVTPDGLAPDRDVTPDGLAPDRDVTPDGLVPDRFRPCFALKYCGGQDFGIVEAHHRLDYELLACPCHA